MCIPYFLPWDRIASFPCMFYAVTVVYNIISVNISHITFIEI